MMPSPGFQALDADQDRVISAEEIANAPGALKKLDQDHDGKLTAAEVRPRMVGRGGRGRGGEGPGDASGPSADDLVQTLMALDKNRDGKLSRDEVVQGRDREAGASARRR
jgi:Ca2+-binding EF-hand superfamily protein